MSTMSSFIRLSRIPYEIPQKYKDAFYCANAHLIDNINWYIHSAYQIVLPELVDGLKQNESSLDTEQAKDELLRLINITEPCNSVVEVNYPVKLENADRVGIKGYRVRHATFQPAASIGGLRLLPNAEKSQLRGISVLTSYRNACLKIPLAGAHGAILVDPKCYKENELREIIQKYIIELTKRKSCGHKIDIFEPDLNTSAREMEWIATTQTEQEDFISSACVTGKPTSLANSLEEYDEQIGKSAVHVLDLFMQNDQIMNKIGLDTDIKNKTFVLQGLGKFGYNIGINLERRGAKCLGIKESDCFIYLKEGLSIEEAYKFQKEHGTLKNFHMLMKHYEADSALLQPCDILVLASIQRTMSCYLAEKVQAKVILEAAYGAITPTAHKTLLGLNKLAIPDVLVAGGIALASYFEYLKNQDFVENGKITEGFLKAIRQYLETIVPCEQRKIAIGGGEEQTVADYETIFQADVPEKDIIRSVSDIILQQNYREILDIASNYHLDLDFRTSAYSKALIYLYKNLFESKLHQ